MKKAFFFIIFIIAGNLSIAQCLISSVTINTGYNPGTGLVVPAGTNGGTPVPDPKWKVTAVTPAIAIALASTTSIPGLIEVVPVASADVVQTRTGWASSAVAQWIDCVNTNLYNTDGVVSTILDMTLAREFKTCVDDSIKLDINVANDNYVQSMNIDGGLLAFSQTPGYILSYINTFTHFTQTVYLTAGTHSFNIVQSNYSPPGGLNGAGLCLYGTISSATGTSSIVAETPSCSSYVCTAVGPPLCDDVISLPDTVHVCTGSAVTLPAALTGTDSVLSILWTPATGLSAPAILTPTLTAVSSGWYYLTVKSLLPDNLVVNGDFSAGNTGFSSAYIYSPPPSSILNEGYYSVYTNPNGVHTGFASFGDHTTGTGNMMILNGASSAVDVWCQTIAVTPNTDYYFSAWFANCSSVTVSPYQPILQFKINGTLLGTPATVTAAMGIWMNFSVLWNSGINTTANICINDALTAAAGNDFVIDDISFQKICVAKDSIYMAVHLNDTAFHNRDSIFCTNESGVLLSGPAGFTSYVWSTGAVSPSVSIAASGQYWVCATNAICHSEIDTIGVTLREAPVVNIGSDTTLCQGQSLFLSTYAVSDSLTWSTGAAGHSITVTATGTYWVTVDSSGCKAGDTIHVTVNPVPVVTLGPDMVICQGQSLVLASSATYTAPSYLWNTGQTSASVNVAESGDYILTVTQNGCTRSDTVNVTVNPLPDVALPDNLSVCTGKEMTIGAPELAGTIYSWSNGSTDSAITVNNAGTYTLTVTRDGCSKSAATAFAVLDLPMPIHLGPDTVLCDEEELLLHSDDSTARWSDGTVGQTMNVTRKGIYWASITNECGISGDTVKVDYAPCNIWFPNAFTPNGDGKNDIARVAGLLAFYTSFRLSIYNRFGQRVFYTEDIYSGWDGTFNGVKQDLGTYFYMIFYTLHGKEHMLKGDLELVR